MSREADIAAVLSHGDPGVHVTAEPEPDGSRIVVEAGEVTYRFSVGPGRSALVTFLITGHVG